MPVYPSAVVVLVMFLVQYFGASFVVGVIAVVMIAGLRSTALGKRLGL